VVPGPPGAAPPPGVLVYRHGGGYVAGSPRAARSVAEALVRRTGLPVLVPAYRRAPEHRFPAALDDALAVLRNLRAHGVPAGRTAVAGDSAGAHLAVGLTAALIRRGEPPPAALALFSPMLNPASAATLDGGAVARDPMLTPSFVLRCAQALAGDADPDDPRVNPLACEDDVLAAFPPVLGLSGSTEYVAGDARELHERLARLGVRSEHRLVAGQVHGFVALHRLLAPARDAVHDGADFLAGALAASRSGPPGPGNHPRASVSR
jgi:epsilon-lactone hydrolase